MNIDDFLAKLKNVKRSGSEWVARCPAHDDRNASLSIREGAGGRILLNCFAGCTPWEVTRAMGLTLADLFFEGGSGVAKARRTNKPTRNFQAILERANPARKDHPYLLRKGVEACPGLKQLKSELLAPVTNAKGKVTGIQRISASGKKKFLAGSKVSGNFFKIHGDAASGMFLCEGIATGLTIRKSTGGTVYVAFSASNLKPVAQVVREKHPEAEITICADNDQWTKGNPGLTAAREAAWAVDGQLAVPRFKNTTTHPTDFNDLDLLEGAQAVAKNLAQAVRDPKPRIQKPAKTTRTGEKQSHLETVLDTAAWFEFFHTRNDEAFARVKIGEHHEVLNLKSAQFAENLAHEVFKQHEIAVSRQTIRDAVQALRGVALFEKPERDVFVRLAGGGAGDKKIYIDLANDAREVVEVSRDGWRVAKDSPVNFLRPKGILPLPRPADSGDIEALWPFLNLPKTSSYEAWILTVAWLIQAFNPHGPYPVLVFNGEQGTAKSSSAKRLRSIVDPNIAPIRTTPRSEHDIAIAASNSHILAYDNVSNMQPWLSDALCRVATGGGFSARQLYTDGDEAIFFYRRPIILNGIDGIVRRHDLADRALFITLPPIPENRRLPEAELNKKFREAQPRIFAGILDALVEALRNIDSVHLSSLPRMADFALWVTAAEPALPWECGKFLAAYTQNRAEIVEAAVDGDSVASAVRRFFESYVGPVWQGSATELLENLEAVTDQKITESKYWPKDGTRLSRRLRRAASFLRTIGLDIDFGKKNGKRVITITRDANRDANVQNRDAKQDLATLEKANDANSLDARDAKDAKKRYPYTYTACDFEQKKERGEEKGGNSTRYEKQRPQRPQRPSVENNTKLNEPVWCASGGETREITLSECLARMRKKDPECQACIVYTEKLRKTGN